MARPRTKFTPELETEIQARMARGESAKTIWAATGKPCSLSTIERRCDAFATKAVRAPIARPPAPALEGVPEAVPSETPLAQIDEWLARVNAAADAAETDGNLSALSSLTAKAVSLLEARRKAQPLPQVDPNENPDLIALAKQSEEKLLKLVDELFASPS